MAKRMLVDATHPEETRVVVVNGNRLEDLDFEIASRKQLKGNIYLAKVTRVEPSLQAAFVEYGGNRHGFLAFSEIHPDYYRIPVADREALLAEEERLQAAEERRLDEQAEAAERRSRHRRPHRDSSEPAEGDIADAPEPDFLAEPETVADAEDAAPADESVAEAAVADEPAADVAAFDDGETDGSAPEFDELTAPHGNDDEDKGGNGGPVVMPAMIEGEEVSEPAPDEPQGNDGAEQAGEDAAEPVIEPAPVEDAVVPAVDAGEGEGALDVVPLAEPAADYAHEHGENLDVIGGDEVEEERGRRPRPLRSYKIQEVIKRRQIMLVQVTKEERGNKGAALTTYLSLPGRYCVLMPNTGRGGGISRKITNPADRKRLKEILSDLDVPRGMAVILRTAGLERSKQEIRRDLEYLMRLWDDIREQTMQSTAPALIYEEANLIKRAIRDGFTDDIDEIWVEGEAGFKTAREFMRMLMPSHIKRVQHYSDKEIPLFHRYQIETQIDAIHSPVVQLRSGGYIVINPTEALVAIDVNSGKSTRERNIEETALKTNLEAADEVARQLRLRDLAGLVVIDYIDMEEPRNNAAVERRLKEAMKSDRARIQLGRISAFGLMELSRQRLRPSLLETNFERCPHCAGTGVIRSVESAALHALRAIEEEGIRKRSAEVTVWVPTRIALYILNNKRADLVRIEERYHFRVNLLADDELIVPDLRIERIKAKTAEDEGPLPITADRVLAETEAAFDAAAATVVEEAEDAEEAPEAEEPAAERNGDASGDYDRRRNRRRRRRGRGERDGVEAAPQPVPGVEDAAPVEGEEAAAEGDEDSDAEPVNGEAGENGENGENGDALARRRRRRGKRGGRRRGRPGEENVNGEELSAEGGEDAPAEAAAPAPVPAPAPVVRAVLPPPGSLSPMDPMDFDWILAGDEPPAPAAEPVVEAAPVEPVAEAPAPVVEAPVEAAPVEPVAEEKPKRKRATRKKKTAEPVDAPAEAAVEAAPVVEAPVEAAPAEPVAEEKPKRKRATRKKKAAEPVDAPAEAVVETAPVVDAPVEAVPVVTEAPAAEPAPAAPAATPSETVNPPTEKPRRGWWNR